MRIWLALLAVGCLGMVCGRVGEPETALQNPEQDQVGGAAHAVPGNEVPKHEIEPHGVIRQKPKNSLDLFRGVALRLLVDAEGNVVSAKPVDRASENDATAVTEAMNWKYVPFEKDGVATAATFVDYVRILPPEQLPEVHRDFPQIKSTAGVVMKLSRTICYGTCPAYNVEIHGDGSVIYSGESFVVVTGTHRDHLSVEQVEELIEAFRNTDYFSLRDGYSPAVPVTDGARYTTSFRVDQLEKSVGDYFGNEGGMPQAVTDLEEAIDRIADTKKWIKGTDETVPLLKREGFDFKSEEATAMLARASATGSTQLVKDLLAAGVDPNGKSEGGQKTLVAAARKGDRAAVQMLIAAGAAKGNVEVKTESLAAAASIGDAELVRRLLAYGGNAAGESRDASGSYTVLMKAAESGVPEVVEQILAGHADVNAVDEQGRTAVFYVLNGAMGLDQQRHADRGEVVRLLTRAGADLNAQDEKGNTALHETHYPEIAAALIKQGADVNARNNEGETPLMTTYSLDVMKLLVASGADVHAKDSGGKTALDHVMEREIDGQTEKYLRGLDQQAKK